MEVVDVAIVGGGPAGSTCAAFCAAAGLRTLVLEREKFPREKVCGDCLNPACWPVLARLELAEEIRNGPHGVVNAVEFIAISGQKLRVDLFVRDDDMISVKRSLFDHLLLDRARTLGAEIREEATLIALDRTAAKNWKIDIVRERFAARVVVGADGRNSTVARLRNLLPRPERERVALQAHSPIPRAIVKILSGEQSALRQFVRAHRAMYRGRLWVNRLARSAVLSPKTASRFLQVARFSPTIMRLLTTKIVRPN